MSVEKVTPYTDHRRRRKSPLVAGPAVRRETTAAAELRLTIILVPLIWPSTLARAITLTKDAISTSSLKILKKKRICEIFRGIFKRGTDSHNKKPRASGFHPCNIKEIPIMRLPSKDPVLFSKTHSSNKIMGYPFRLRNHTVFTLLGTSANRSLVNTLFARLANHLLGPLRVQRIKVVKGQCSQYNTRPFSSPSPWALSKLLQGNPRLFSRCKTLSCVLTGYSKTNEMSTGPLPP